MTYLASYLSSITGVEKTEVTSSLLGLMTMSWVSVMQAPYNAVGDGVTDDTAAIQAAFDSGARAVYFPPCDFAVTSLTMPDVFNFVVCGEGASSTLIQMSGGSDAMLCWDRSDIVYNEQTIRNLGFNGAAGSQNIIDTRGAGGITCHSLYITDVPVGKSGIYSEGVNGVYDHDARLINIQIYSNTAGHSGIRFGPLSSDCEVVDFIMNGNFVTDYCLYLDIGAQSVLMTGGHPYNAKINVLRLAGDNAGVGASNTCFDNALQDIVTIVDSDNVRFTGTRIQAVKPGYSGVKITGTGVGFSFINTTFDGAFGSLSCVSATSGSSNVLVFGGQVPSIGNFSNPFNLAGAYSDARGIAGYFPLGLRWSQAGVQSSAQAQATTQYLGAGSSATEINAEYVVPHDSQLINFYVSVSTTPASGQTRTFRARRNGVDVGTALVVSNGQFGGTVTVGENFQQYDRLTISSVYSATAGSATARWSAEFKA